MQIHFGSVVFSRLYIPARHLWYPSCARGLLRDIYSNVIVQRFALGNNSPRS